MGERRHFDNPFPQSYNEEETTLLASDGKIEESFRKKISDKIGHFLATMKEGVSKEESNDFSVYTGVSGIALLYLHLYKAGPLKNDREQLLEAGKYIKRPLRHLKKHRVTFLCGDAGPLAVGAVLYNLLEEFSESQDCLRKLLDLHHQVLRDESLPDELLYGRVGYLFALLFVQKHLGKDVVDVNIILQICHKIIKSGQQTSHQQHSKCPLMYEWHDKNYFGAAHGLCGIFYILMKVDAPSLNSQIEDLVRPSIDYMLKLQFPSGNCPSSHGSTTDKLIHWCHGAPGWIYMFVAAYQRFQDDKYLTAAKQCAEVIWHRGLLQKGYGICHGTAGNAYAFLLMFKVTKEKTYLYKATKFAEWCLDYGKHGCRTPDRPFSLFEGMAGTIYFLADLMDPSNAKFPAFEL